MAMTTHWLLNKTRFCINENYQTENEGRCYWGLPSISADDPTFPPLGYWRGYVWYVCFGRKLHTKNCCILHPTKRLRALLFCLPRVMGHPGLDRSICRLPIVFCFTYLVCCCVSSRGPMAQLTYWSLQQYDHLPVVRSARKAMCKQMTAMFLEQYGHAIAAILNRISFGYCHV